MNSDNNNYNHDSRPANGAANYPARGGSNQGYPQNRMSYPPGYGSMPPQPNQPVRYPPAQAPFPQGNPQLTPDQPLASLSSEKRPKNVSKKNSGLPLSEIMSRIFVGILTAFIVVYMGWLFAPKIRNSMTFWPTQTPTPVTPSPTPPATMTVTPLPTNTPLPTSTPTPGPISNYWIADGSVLDPAVPNAPEGLVILSAKNSADVEPALDSIYWTSSKQIVQDLGNMNSLYDSEWFATINSGAIRYYMDQSLKEGLYEVYVMDTYYSSGGNLDFLVRLGEQILTPLTSTASVTFMTSQYEPHQNMDTWRSLGIYYLMPSKDILTVSTSWGMRDEYTYVAADRVMIVPRKITDLTLLNTLPASGTKYIMDNTEASIIAGNSLFNESTNTSWDDSYQLIINPKTKCSIEYSSKEPWPIGSYSIYIYLPESKGGLDADIQVRTDNTILETVYGESTVRMHIPTGGNWVLVGQYNTDRYYERPVKFKVNITISENQSGEYPVDAIAFIHQPF